LADGRLQPGCSRIDRCDEQRKERSPDHVSILIDGSPQIAALTLDGDKEFIDVPDVAQCALFPP